MKRRGGAAIVLAAPHDPIEPGFVASEPARSRVLPPCHERRTDLLKVWGNSSLILSFAKLPREDALPISQNHQTLVGRPRADWSVKARAFRKWCFIGLERKRTGPVSRLADPIENLRSRPRFGLFEQHVELLGDFNQGPACVRRFRWVWGSKTHAGAQISIRGSVDNF